MPTLAQLEADAANANQALREARRRLSSAQNAVMSAHDERHRIVIRYAQTSDREAARVALDEADQKVSDAIAAYEQIAGEYGV